MHALHFIVFTQRVVPIFCLLPNMFTTSGKILQPATTLFILLFLYRSLSQGCSYWTKHWKRFRVHRLMGQSNSRKKRGLFCITVNLTIICYRTTERKSLKHFWLLQWWKSGELKRVKPSLVPFDFLTVFSTRTVVTMFLWCLKRVKSLLVSFNS